MKTLLIIFFALALFSCDCVKENSSTLVQSTPKKAGFSPERLALADTLIMKFMEKNRLPGGVFLVARKGKIAYYKNFGYRSTKKDNLYQKDDIFRIASMTKAVTSVAIMQLFERGLLRLDEPVSNYIPAFKQTEVLNTFNEKDSSYTTVPVKRAITIRHLLTHTSGIAYGDFLKGKINAVYAKNNMLGVGLSHDQWNTEEFINNLAKVPLVFQPGEKYLYGLNVDVLGRVVEVVSGKNLAEYFHDHIFQPLGMKDTYFYLPPEKHHRLVPLYSQSDKGVTMSTEDRVVRILNYPKSKDIGHYAGGGGLSSTAMDYAKFIQALVNDGELNGFQLLGRKTIEMMTADQLIDQNNRGTGFSQTPGVTFNLGFQLLTEEARGLSPKSPGTYEWGGYFSTKYFIDPEEDLIFVGMTQILPFQHAHFYDRLTTVIYGAIEN